MFGSTMLEVAIGVIFVFILVSIICTAIREGLESWLKTRAAYLEHGIRQLLADDKGVGLAKDIYTHPLIFGLFNNDYKPGSSTGSPALFARGDNLPSYIPSRNFALALMDIAARGPMTDDFSKEASEPIVTLKTLRQNVANLGSPSVQRLLITAIDSAQNDLNRAQANIEDWYNSGMDRVSGWYKRSTQLIIFSLALIVAIALNINTITIASYLSKNKTSRELLLKEADKMSKQETLKTDSNSYKANVKRLNQLRLPIGWPEDGKFCLREIPSIFFAGIVGWLLTALAASLGAPFWFDTLNKVMVIRSTVKPHEKSQEEASEDRQMPPSNVAKAAVAPVAVAPALQPVITAPVMNMAADIPEEGAQGDSPAAQPAAVSQPQGGDEIDGCDLEVDPNDKTNDEDLPPTQGGVA